MDFLQKYGQFFTFLIIVVLFCGDFNRIQAKNAQKTVINDMVDVKDFKKLLRTKTNVLTLFINSVKQNSNIIKVFEETADYIRGQGTMVLVDCSSEAKKLCKKLKVSPDPYILKHYKDGEFHKNYDRKETVSSMLNFMRDPTGDIPWDEDPSTSGIVHISDPTSLNKFLRKELGPVMIMFYAPWCGFCKQLKPEYAGAAAELKGHSILAAVDVNKPENAIIRRRFNITGFPTLIYFEGGMKKFNYEGDNNKKSIIEFMKNPSAVPTKPVEVDWASSENEVKHLKDDTFQETIKQTDSILVMFYAPWCGHCKRLKPEYEKAAETLKSKNIKGVLAALDATKETKTAKKFNVNGYPTLKYFKKGEFQFDVNIREEKELVEFMMNPKKPPPPPPPEKPWAEEESEVVHLTTETFKPFLKKKRHVLVMFYAPWCGHCKKAKPEFTASAEEFKDDPKIEFAAIDCTSHKAVCSTYNVKGYPTIKVFHYLNKEPVEDYTGGRTKQDFTSYMKKFAGEKKSELPTVAKTQKEEKTDKIQTEKEKAEKVAKTEKAEKVAKTEKPEKVVKTEKPEKVSKTEKPEKMSKTERPEKISKTERPEKISATERPEKISATERPEKISTTEKPEKLSKSDWDEYENSDLVLHLTDSSFDYSIQKHDLVLVFFYKSGCEDCKNIMKEYSDTALMILNAKLPAKMAAYDATKNKKIVGEKNITDFPTIQFYKGGEFVKNYTGKTTAEYFFGFLKAANVDSKKDEL